LCLGTLANNSTRAKSPKQKETKTKLKKYKIYGPIRPGKGLVYEIRAETRRQNIALFSLSWEYQTTQFFATLCMFMSDHESAVSINLGVTNKF